MDEPRQKSILRRRKEDTAPTQFKSIHSNPHNDFSNDEGWLVSYADLMTLLFGFFVLLYAMSTVDREKFAQIQQAAATALSKKNQVISYPTETLKTDIVAKLRESGLNLDDITVEQTHRGLKVSLKAEAFFKSGTTKMSGKGFSFVNKVGSAIANSKDLYQVRVEGHTDSVPIRGPLYPSNWELSASRATLVVRILINRGVESKNIEAVGLGASRPIAKERDQAGRIDSSALAKNRRVVIEVSVPHKTPSGSWL